MRRSVVRGLFLAPLALLLPVGSARAESEDVPTLRANGLPGELTLDGILSEPVWAATDAIENTKDWVAKRGRQQFTGDRSKGTPDPGIVAIATMMNDLCARFGVPGSANIKTYN